MAVIDSSTLIRLAKINKLDLLQKLKTNIITTKEVEEETVGKGIMMGHNDATKIKKFFSEGIIRIESPKQKDILSGISKIDSQVINLAKETDYLFADDVKLGRKAKAERIEVRNTADVLLHLTRTGRLGKKEGKELLEVLVKEKRLTQTAKNKYLEAMKNDRNS